MTNTPFIGLNPFSENVEDAQFFFGRERQIKNLIEHLKASRLTILYGKSGVGKSSILRAGVAYRLQQQAKEDIKKYGIPQSAVVVFPTLKALNSNHQGQCYWQNQPLSQLIEQIKTDLEKVVEEIFEKQNKRESIKWPDSEGSFVETLQWWTNHLGGPEEDEQSDLFIILDQFEDYLLSHSAEEDYNAKRGTFAYEFCRAVNHPKLRVNFMIAIREEYFTQLSRFQGRISDIMRRGWELEPLHWHSGKEAIQKPVEKYNQIAKVKVPMSIGKGLVDAVLEQVIDRNEIESNRNRSTQSDQKPIDASSLQLVMRKLWDVEINRRPSDHYCLQRETLNKKLGGAQGIVMRHWENQINSYSFKEKFQSPTDKPAIISSIIRHLAMPSGRKIALTFSELSFLANGAQARFGRSELPESVIRDFLKTMSQPKSRILNTLPGDRYEIFCPIFGKVVFNWVEGQNQLIYWEQKAQEALKQFKFSQTEALNNLMAINQCDHKEELLPKIPAVFKLALQQTLDNIREQKQIELQPTAHSFYGVGFSHDGQKLAIGSLNDGKIYLWDLERDKSLKPPLIDPSGSVYCVSFSRNGKQLVSSSMAGTVSLWNLEEESPTPLKLWEDKTDEVYFATFRPPDGQQVVATLGNKVAHLFDLQGNKLKSFEHEGLVYFASFSRDGQKLASVSWISRPDGDYSEIGLWNVESGNKENTIPLNRGEFVYRLSFSGNGQKIVYGTWGGNIYVQDLKDPPHQTRFTHEEPVYFASFTGDDQHLVTAGWDGTIRRWDLSGNELVKFTVNREPAYRAYLSDDEQQLTTVSSKGIAHVWSLKDCASDIKGKNLPIVSFEDGNCAVYRFSFNPDKKKIQFVSASTDGIVRLWDIEKSDEPLKRFTDDEEDFDGSVYSVCFSPDGKLVVSGSEDGKIRLWDLTQELSNKPRKTLSDHNKRVYFVCFSPDGKLLASASEDGTVRLWKCKDWLKDEPQSKVIQQHTGPIYCVSFSSDGKQLASASIDGRVRLWNLEDLDEPKPVIQGHAGTVYCANFNPQQPLSPDESYPCLATASQDGSVGLWDLKGNLLNSCLGHEGQVYWVTFSPDGQKIATASQDGSVRLWNLQGEQIAKFRDHQHKQQLFCVQFSPDGKKLATASADGTVKIRPVEDLTQLLARGALKNSC